MSGSVCLSVCPRVYLRNQLFKHQKNSTHVTYPYRSILLSRPCDVMYNFRFCGWRHVIARNRRREKGVQDKFTISDAVHVFLRCFALSYVELR